MSKGERTLQDTREGPLEVGVKMNGTDLARTAALSAEARGLMCEQPVVDEETGNYPNEYHKKPVVCQEVVDDAAAVRQTLKRIAVLRLNAVAAHNAVADALTQIVDDMRARDSGVLDSDRDLIDEMHVLKGAAHRAALQASGAAAAAGNLYNTVRKHIGTETQHTPPHTSTQTKKEKEKK
jgi:hypothetical protein